MIDLTKASTVHIGRRGEHHFRNVEFDVSSLLGDDYPSTSLQAIYKRPDGTAYPVVTNYAASVLTWSPSATDTEIVGVGQLEIRVVFGDVVGKSVKVLTIVEEALVDGIVTPPEPPAQEWLNQVLSALAALNIDDVYSLLNLTYDLLNDNYTLLGTTHGLLSDNYTLLGATHDLLNDSHTLLENTHTDIIAMRGHAIYTHRDHSQSFAPGGNRLGTRTWPSRRASITFTGISAGQQHGAGQRDLPVCCDFEQSCGKHRTGTGSELSQRHRQEARRSHTRCSGCSKHCLWQRNKPASHLHGLLDKAAVFHRGYFRCSR